LSCLQKLAMELCSPELASTDAQTTPSIDKGYAGAAASMQKAGTKKVIGRGTVSSETPKRQRDSTLQLRKTPPKKSKSHGNNTALQADAVTQIPAAKPAMHESTSGPKGNWTKVSGRQKTRERIRSDAIAVSGVGGCSYSDILKMVKSDPTLKHLSSDVKSIRKATNGDLLIKMDTKPAHSSDELKDAVSKALGSRAVVKKLTETAQVEIWDLDELVSKEEVLESVKLALDDSTLNCEAVKSLRALKDGQQVATLVLPAAKSKVLVDKRKIRIGWVVCRIRPILQPKRCYKCLGYGHMAAKCTSDEDLKGACFKCGDHGHLAKACIKPAKCRLCIRNGEKMTDHAAGSFRCPVYKEAVSKMRC